jgi:hypothetical protein
VAFRDHFDVRSLSSGKAIDRDLERIDRQPFHHVEHLRLNCFEEVNGRVLTLVVEYDARNLAAAQLPHPRLSAFHPEEQQGGVGAATNQHVVCVTGLTALN